MAQVTLDLPDAVANRLRSEARRARKSLSAYVAELLEPAPARGGWPQGFFELAGSTTIELEDDPPPSEPPGL